MMPLAAAPLCVGKLAPLTACPDENVLTAYSAGLMEGAERAAVEAHFEGCAMCRAVSSAVARDPSTTDLVSHIEAPVLLGAVAWKPGDIVDGKFRIESRLGEGGMGIVFAATNLKLDQRVALKFLRPEASKNPKTLARFFQEARTSAKLRNAHSVQVLDLVDGPELTPYLVMELLEGEDLEHRLRRGPVSVQEAVAWSLQSLHALGEAHAHGLIHRDVKPGNVFLSPRQNGEVGVRLLDFGLAKLFEREEGLTMTGQMIGSPRYMAPEQFAPDQPLGPWTDVWSLGCVLFEMLTGKPPFDAPQLVELANNVQRGIRPSVRSLRDDVPVEIEAVIDRCLKVPVRDRFQTAPSMARALLPWAGPYEKTLVLPMEAVAPSVSEVSEAMSPTEQLAVPATHRRGWAPVLVTAFVVVAGFVYLALWPREPTAAAVRPPMQVAPPVVVDVVKPPPPPTEAPVADAGSAVTEQTIPATVAPKKRVPPRKKTTVLPAVNAYEKRK